MHSVMSAQTSGTPSRAPEGWLSMARRIGAVILFGALALGGCALAIGDQPAASPAFTPQAECTRNGGWWRQSMNFCEYR